MTKLNAYFDCIFTENDWHVEHLTDVSNKFLHFDAWVLLNGFYVVECRAFVKINDTEYGASEWGYFQMNLNPPRIILEKGDGFRTVDGEEDIVLDATASFDDSFPEQTPYTEYTWTCLPNCTLGPWKGK